MKARWLLAPVAAWLASGCGARPAAAPTAAAEGTPPAAATAQGPTGDTTVRKRQVDEAPTISASAVSLLDSGRQQAASGDLEAAKKSLLQAAKADPHFAEAYYNVGVIEEWQGNTDAARRAYDRALQARADFGPAVTAIGSLLVRAGDPEGALRFAEEQLQHAPQSNGLRNAVNSVRLSLGRSDEVIRDSKEVLRRDEKNVGAMQNLAEAYFQQGKYELAIAILNNARELEPNDPGLLGRIALAQLKLNEKLKARKALEDAVALPGGATAEIYNNLGLVYHEAGDYAGAEDMFRKALQRWPGMLAARVNLGNALKGEQKYAEADAVLRDALEQAPKSADVLYNLAILYLDGQIPGMEPIARLERALAYFEQYRQVVPKAGANDPVDQYVAEAQKRIDVEKKKAAQARQAPKPAGGEAAKDGDAAKSGDGGEAAKPAGEKDKGGDEK